MFFWFKTFFWIYFYIYFNLFYLILSLFGLRFYTNLLDRTAVFSVKVKENHSQTNTFFKIVCICPWTLKVSQIFYITEAQNRGWYKFNLTWQTIGCLFFSYYCPVTNVNHKRHATFITYFVWLFYKQTTRQYIVIFITKSKFLSGRHIYLFSWLKRRQIWK